MGFLNKPDDVPGSAAPAIIIGELSTRRVDLRC